MRNEFKSSKRYFLGYLPLPKNILGAILNFVRVT